MRQQNFKIVLTWIKAWRKSMIKRPLPSKVERRLR